MINPDELVWVARYKDGSIHTQYSQDGTYSSKYADIVRDQLFSFELWKNDALVLRVYFDTPNKKLIYRRRVYKKSDGSEMVLYLVGWQINQEGYDPVQSISVVFPDGHIEVIGKWNKNSQYFDQPIVHPHEGEDWKVDSLQLNQESVTN